MYSKKEEKDLTSFYLFFKQIFLNIAITSLSLIWTNIWKTLKDRP